MKPEEIDRLYKRTFEQYKGEVPAELWEDIATEIGPNRGRRGIIWFIGGMLMLGIGLLAGQTFFALASENETISTNIKTYIPDSPKVRSLLPSIPEAVTTDEKTLSVPKKSATLPKVSMIATKHSPSPILEKGLPHLEVLDVQIEKEIKPIQYTLTGLKIHYQLPSYISQGEKPFTLARETSQLKGSFYADVTPFLAYHHIHPNLEDNVFTSFSSIPPDLSFE
ncbi:MAG: hypothetical protein AAFR66_10795, partial [Bacteroidota bacterium]